MVTSNHTQNTTHLLKVLIDWEEKGRGIGNFHSYVHEHTKHNSPTEVDNRFGGNGDSSGHFQSYMNTKNTTHCLK